MTTRYILTEQARWARDNKNFAYFEMLLDQLACEALGERRDRGVKEFITHQTIIGKANLNSAREWGEDSMSKQCLQQAVDCIKLGERVLFYGLK